MSFGFDETKHPRAPKGSGKGGQFQAKGEGGGDGGAQGGAATPKSPLQRRREADEQRAQWVREKREAQVAKEEEQYRQQRARERPWVQALRRVEEEYKGEEAGILATMRCSYVDPDYREGGTNFDALALDHFDGDKKAAMAALRDLEKRGLVMDLFEGKYWGLTPTGLEQAELYINMAGGGAKKPAQMGPVEAQFRAAKEARSKLAPAPAGMNKGLRPLLGPPRRQRP